MALQWGIVGAGKICSDFVEALKIHPETNHKIVAVGSRTLESAQNFAKIHQIPVAYGGYEEVASDQTVEVVYIGLVNTLHLKVAKLMLESGKHVVCEKPLTMSLKETRELIDCAKQKKLFLMEAIWSRCFPVYDELRMHLEEGRIGDVLQVSVDIGFALDFVDSSNVKSQGLSAVLNVGLYALQFSQFVFKNQEPLSVLSSGHTNEHGTDDAAAAILTYPGGRTSTLTISGLTGLSNAAYIYGTEGVIKIPTFWYPTTLITPEEILTFPLPNSLGTFNYPNSAGLAYEAEEARRCIREGLTESPKITHAETLKLAELMEILRRNIYSSISSSV